jgi:signal transduction histidine kinase
MKWALATFLGIPAVLWIALLLALAALIGALRRRRQPRPPQELWQALGGTPTPGQDGWEDVFALAAQQSATAMDGRRQHLRAITAEARLVLTQEVLGALQDGIVVVDATERVIYANATARRVLQLGDEPHPRLEQSDTRPEILQGIRSVLAADLARSVKTCRIEWEADDRQFVYLIRAMAQDAQGDPPRTQVIVFEDWTAEERASRAKSEFIYGVSHELKTPLTSIQASLEMAADSSELPAPDRDKLIRISYEESVRLSQMVSELLDLARVEAGLTQFRHERVDMRELFQSILGMHQPLAELKAIDLKWDVSDYLADPIGDPRLLRQALVNIVGNAVKYTKEGGMVALTARLEGSELVVRVRDSGIGIASEDQPRVFEKFFRAKSAEQSAIQGTGLGLPMARYIVERHRGRIELSSELGVGTEFRIYLPVLSTDSEEEGSSSLIAVEGTAS